MRLGPLTHPSTSRERGRRYWKVKLLTLASDFINHTHIKIQKVWVPMGFWIAEHREMLKDAAPRQGWMLHNSFHIPCPTQLFQLLSTCIFCNILYNEWVKWNVPLSAVSCSRKLVKLEVRVVGTLDLQPVKKHSSHQVEAGTVLSLWALNVRNLTLSFKETVHN